MEYVTTPQSKKTIDALWRLEKIILDTLDFNDVVQRIVDSVLSELGYLKLGYRIVVLALLDEKTKTLKRISISQTDEAEKALAVTPVPFHEIDIPISATSNICARAVLENKPFTTHDWVEILCPPYTAEEAKKVQNIVGIKTSMVYPVISKGEAIGVIIFSMVKDDSEVSENERDLIRGFTDIVGLSVQNAKLYTSLDETKKQLQVANVKLQELDKLKNDFVSVASHELRTPMTAIKSFLWLALNKQQDNLTADLKRYLDRAYVSCERLISLVNDMLNISRIEGGKIALKLEEVDLIALASEVYEELQPRAIDRGITLSVEKSDIAKVLCDKNKIHEVFVNLVGNSLKFTPKGGKITISFKLSGEKVVTEVADTGRGISKDDMKKLFTKFGRLENSYVGIAESGGTGLGLFIIKSLVSIHNGETWAESDGVGKGSKFFFSLPISGTKLAEELIKNAPKETADTKELEITHVNL